jgi:hypothetical protein
VHWVPAGAALAVVAVPAIAGAIAFTDATSDPGTTPAAPLAGFVVWAAWTFPLVAVGIFVTLLAYTLVLPARSNGLLVTQIVLTSLAGMVALMAVIFSVFLW